MRQSIEKFFNNSDLKSSVGSSFNSYECLILPGSFNPFHLGHQGLFEFMAEVDTHSFQLTWRCLVL